MDRVERQVAKMQKKIDLLAADDEALADAPESKANGAKEPLHCKRSGSMTRPA